MACELIGALMLAPFFGTSLYVWAAVLGLTLGGLMCGYFLGGVFSRRYAGNTILLFWILIFAGVFLALMPVTSKWIMGATIGLSLQSGAIISLLVFMFPPLILMGMASPVLISLLTENAEAAGNSAGNVYSISTLGGILLTFLMGFYIIPQYGLSNPAYIGGVILAVLPVISLLKRKIWLSGLALPIFVVIQYSLANSMDRYSSDYKVLYQSEGILGQLKVVDHPAYEFTSDARMGRALIVNNTAQTFVGLDNNLQYSIWDWSYYFPLLASVYPPDSKVLLLGLGGGTLVKQLQRLHFEIDVVEIDERIREVSVRYFNVDPGINVIIDDARHYIRTCSTNYDMIIYDTFLSESVPEHLLTKEGFSDARAILEDDGMIMINFYGFLNGRKGRAARAVYATLSNSGLYTKIVATPGEEASRNLIFVASGGALDFSETNYEEPHLARIEDMSPYFLNDDDIDTAGAMILSDKRPQLSKLYAQAAISWKKSYNAYYRRHFSGYKP